MQGTLIDYNGEAVKDAVIRVRKITAAAGEEALEITDRYEDGTGQHGTDGLITAQTDAEGNFVLGDLDPEARYIFQIHRKETEKTSLPEKKELLAKVRVAGWEKPVEDRGENRDEEDRWKGREEEDGWDDDRDEEDGWDDEQDEKDDWDDEHEERDDLDDERDRKDKAPSNIASADLEDEYDDSEWFDIQEQEVLEQYAGNMIKPKKDLEDRLITIRKYIW